MRYLNFLILTALVGLSMVVSSCKTKKKSSPAAAPPGELTPGDGDACENPLALSNAKSLPAVSASQLRVSKVFVQEPSIGNSEKIYISSASGSATPDLYIYRGHKSSKVSKYAASYKGVTRATCQPSSTNEECFTGLTFSGLNIDSNIPDGALKIEAWACIGAGGKRVKQGQTYQRVAYRDTVYYCGQAKVSRDDNQHIRKSSVEDRLGLIDDAIKSKCQSAYNKLTSEKNLEAAKNSSDTMLKSLYGLVAMGPGAFISECVLNLDEIVTAVSFAEEKKSSKSGLALANTAEECEAEVPEDEFDEYVTQTPPPVVTDPVAVIPPVEPDPVPEPVAEEPTETEEPEVAETPTKRDQCKLRGETLSETIGGNTEWVPDVSSEDKENNGTCFVNHEDGSQTQIEPSIAEQPVEEEPEPAPTPSKKGLSTAQNWGVAFMVIGGSAAASAYVYNSNSEVRTRVDRAFTPAAPLKEPEEIDFGKRTIDHFDTQIDKLNSLNLSGSDGDVRDAQVAELSNRKELILLNNDLAITRGKMTVTPEAWNDLEEFFSKTTIYAEADIREGKAPSEVVEISSKPPLFVSTDDAAGFRGTQEQLRSNYEKWSTNQENAAKYNGDYSKVLAKKQEWDTGVANKDHRKLLDALAENNTFKTDMKESRGLLTSIDEVNKPWSAFNIDDNGKLFASNDLPGSIKPVTAPKGAAVEFGKVPGASAYGPGKGRFSGYVRTSIYLGLSVALLGAAFINFGLSDSSKKDGGVHLVAGEAKFLAALYSCKKIKDNKKFFAVGCDKVLAAALN
ncbi:MAG: hypothetical protein AB8G05_27070 [Oligoflexales bacterium]